MKNRICGKKISNCFFTYSWPTHLPKFGVIFQNGAYCVLEPNSSYIDLGSNCLFPWLPPILIPLCGASWASRNCRKPWYSKTASIGRTSCNVTTNDIIQSNNTPKCIHQQCAKIYTPTPSPTSDWTSTIGSSSTTSIIWSVVIDSNSCFINFDSLSQHSLK